MVWVVKGKELVFKMVEEIPLSISTGMCLVINSILTSWKSK